MADLTQVRDYNKQIDESVEDELTKLMEGLNCSVSVVDYVDADEDDQIECDSDVTELRRLRTKMMVPIAEIHSS